MLCSDEVILFLVRNIRAVIEFIKCGGTHALFKLCFILANLANERIDAFIERIVHILRPLLRTEYHTVVDNGYLNCLT